MDFIFSCALCRGPLVARTDHRGRRMRCPHCEGPVEIRHGEPVTEAFVNSLLDASHAPAPNTEPLLRRVRPAPQHSSAGSSRDRLARTARISFPPRQKPRP